MIEKSATWAWYCRMSVGMPVAFAILSSKSVCAKLGATTASHDRCRKPPLIFLGLHPTCVLSPRRWLCFWSASPEVVKERLGCRAPPSSSFDWINSSDRSKAVSGVESDEEFVRCAGHLRVYRPRNLWCSTYHFRWSSSTEKARVGT